MKKLIFFLTLSLAFIGLQAQDVTLRMADKTYVEYNTNVSVPSAATKWFLIIGDQHVPQTQDFVIHLDSISGGAHATTVKLFGTKFGTTYTQIGSTVTWKATTADTTILFSNDTINRYRNYKVEVVNDSADVTTIDYLKFKLWRE
jgi:hypothetical protein